MGCVPVVVAVGVGVLVGVKIAVAVDVVVAVRVAVGAAVLLGVWVSVAVAVFVGVAGGTAATKTASDKWYANADEIATFLNSANPDNWPLDDLKKEMKMHLDLTLAEATAYLKGDSAADIKAYDDVHNEILGMADILSSGIMKQFPDMFPSQAKS